MAPPDLVLLDLGVGGAVARVFREGSTGRLLLRRNTNQLLLYFARGTLVSAEGGNIDDALGRRLLQDGRINETQLSQAVDLLKEDMAMGGELRMGEALLRLGALTTEALADALAAQLEARVVASMQWPQVESALEPWETDAIAAPGLPSIAVLLRDGIRLHYDPRRVAALLEPLRTTFPRLATAAPVDLALSDLELRWLQSLVGDRPLDDAWKRSTIDWVPCGQLLVLLLHLGVIGLLREPAPGVVATTRHRPRVDTVVERLAPRRDRRPTQQPMQIRQFVLQRIGQGKPSKNSAQEHAEKLARLQAEGAFRKARRYITQGALAPALEELKQAVKHRPDVLEYGMFASFVEFRMETLAGPKREAAERTTRLCNEVLQQQKNSFDAHVILAELAHVSGDRETALVEYEWAAEINPADRDVLKAIKQLQAEREKPPT